MSQRLRKVVFPVAGLGTRFLPATKVVAKEMLPALKAVRQRLGESENCVLRGYFIACGEEKFVETFRKWE